MLRLISGTSHAESERNKEAPSDTDSSLNTKSRFSTKPPTSPLTTRPVIVAKIGLFVRPYRLALVLESGNAPELDRSICLEANNGQTDLTISDFLHVVAVHDGNIVQLTFEPTGRQDIGPIRFSRAEAIAAGGDITRNGSTKGIPINFSPDDATTFGPWLMRFARE